MESYASAANQPFGGVTLTIPKNGGSAISVAGEADDDLLTTVAAHKLRTLDLVTLTVTTGLTGLTTATDYYVIRASATTFKLATTAALAAAGTAVNITADGTGTVVLKGQSYQAFGFNPKSPTTEKRRNNTDGSRRDFKLIAEPSGQTGLQLQLATEYTPTPRRGWEFSDPHDSTITWVISGAEKNEPEGDFHTASIDFTNKDEETA